MGMDGLPVPLKGVIWSGFENGTMVSGLQVSCHSCGPILATACLSVTHHDEVFSKFVIQHTPMTGFSSHRLEADFSASCIGMQQRHR
jgi:hypothetical protein